MADKTEDPALSLPLERPDDEDTPPEIDWPAENRLIDEAMANGNIFDRKWRLNNLYFVKHVKHGVPCRFQMTEDHDDVFHSQYVDVRSKRLVILKARQLYMTTYGLINMIDACCFQADRHCILSNFSEEESDMVIEDKAHYLVRNTPWLKRLNIATKTDGLNFPRTGSDIVVSVTARGHKSDYAHITEFAKTSDDDPKKAREILKAMGAGSEYGYVTIESTGKGDTGPFAEIIKTAWERQQEGAPLDRLDWVLKFYPWWTKRLNRLWLPPGTKRPYDDELEFRFDEVERIMRTRLDQEQRNWYGRTLTSGFNNRVADMRQEHPATLDEALTTDVEGYVLRGEVIRMQDEGRIGDYRAESNRPVLCFWDFGFADNTAVIFVQVDEATGSYRVVDEVTNNQKRMAFYFNEVSNREFNVSHHVLPWDACGLTSHASKLTGSERETLEAHFHSAGLHNTVVMPRLGKKRAGFEACKSVIGQVHIASHCGRLVHSLKNVRRMFHSKSGHYDDELQKGREENHFYDAFELFCRAMLTRPELVEDDRGTYIPFSFQDRVDARARMFGYGQRL